MCQSRGLFRLPGRGITGGKMLGDAKEEKTKKETKSPGTVSQHDRCTVERRCSIRGAIKAEAVTRWRGIRRELVREGFFGGKLKQKKCSSGSGISKIYSASESGWPVSGGRPESNRSKY